MENKNKIKNVTYSEFVGKLVKNGQDIIDSLTPEKADAWHMSSALCGEAGELFDAVKRWVIYEKDIDMENVLEELGDLEFYLQRIRDIFGFERSDVIQHNINKLSKRYESLNFSNEQAQKRADKECDDSDRDIENN
jgi:NTP pyrophosphatase (non-canonical NTP hydrolase)